MAYPLFSSFFNKNSCYLVNKKFAEPGRFFINQVPLQSTGV